MGGGGAGGGSVGGGGGGEAGKATAQTANSGGVKPKPAGSTKRKNEIAATAANAMDKGVSSLKLPESNISS